MPYLACQDGVELHYRLDGADAATVLVLSNSLGTNLGMSEPQTPALKRHFHVLRYDARGHGQSGLSPAPYQVDRLGKDVVGPLARHGIDRAHSRRLSLA